MNSAIILHICSAANNVLRLCIFNIQLIQSKKDMQDVVAKYKATALWHKALASGTPSPSQSPSNAAAVAAALAGSKVS